MVANAARAYARGTMTTPPPYPGPQPPSSWVVPMSNTQATLALVLGILGMMSCPILSPMAWLIGHSAEREMDARPDLPWGNRDHAKVGKITGMVATIFYGLLVLAIVAMWVVTFVIAAGASAT